MSELKITAAQVNPVVGDIPGNTARVLAEVKQALASFQSDVVVFPELMLCGYPPEDLLLRSSMNKRVSNALQLLCEELPRNVFVVLGYPQKREQGLANTVGVLYNGEIIAEYDKQVLPNYQVFDEARYFTQGNTPCVVDMNGVMVGLTICEDIWHETPSLLAKRAGAELIISINASPFHQEKQIDRAYHLQERVKKIGLPILYVNMVGGQDELVFDGQCFALNKQALLVMQAPLAEEGLFSVIYQAGDLQQGTVCSTKKNTLADIYKILVLGLKDYVQKSGFSSAILGLSGGIDSALTLAIAVDALGSDKVTAVMMPYRYTSQMSLDDAKSEADALGVSYKTLAIEPLYNSFMATLADEFAGFEADLTEQNLQARIRGVLLMALSNKKGPLVLTTGNKSEIAVGYSTLYGDMAGGFNILKDVPKTLVYALSRYRNELSPVIPVRVIERAPSAELAPDQKDEDSLPPYDVLDKILHRYIEKDESAKTIIEAGFSEEVVLRVVQLVDRNEYKRRQAPIGPRISQRGFGRDRRYPIVSGWKAGT